MSSARKRAAIRKANNEADSLRQKLMLVEHQYASISAVAVELARKCDALQAKIDALMLEYCPDEMTDEQKEEWARSQRPAQPYTLGATDEEALAIHKAEQRSRS